jgi:hypothetical protein
LQRNSRKYSIGIEMFAAHFEMVVTNSLISKRVWVGAAARNACGLILARDVGM